MNWSKSIVEFLFPARSSSSLTILRGGLGLSVIFFCLSFSSSWSEAFTNRGNTLIGRDIAEAIAALGNPTVPRLGWLVSLGGWFGVSEKAVLWTSYVTLLFSGGCLVLGFLSRMAALTAWFLHLAAVTSAGLASYGVDQFMTIGLFYLVIAPLPKTSVFSRKQHSPATETGQLFGFFQRVLQLHLCFIYFFGGLAKCVGPDWWNGGSIWRALTRPPFDQITPQILVGWSAIFPVAGICVCLIEICYPIFIWPRKTRDAWLLLVTGMHCAIGLMMGMYLFGFVMIVLNISAFGPGSSWDRLLRLFVSQMKSRFEATQMKVRIARLEMPRSFFRSRIRRV